MPELTTVTSFGRVISVQGSLARVGLLAASQLSHPEVRATVGRFVSIRCSNSTIVAMITEVSCENLPTSDIYIASASVDLLGEILGGPVRPKFQRGVTNYPTIGDTVELITNQELRTVYAPTGSDQISAGTPQQDAAVIADLPPPRAQRRWPLLRRPLAGAQSAQSETAVLAVQFRGNRRRAVRRPSRRAGGTRHPRRSDPDGEGNLYAIPERRPGRVEAHRSQGDRLYRRHPGAVPAGRPDLADRRAHGQAREPLVAHHLSQADFAHRDRAQRSALRLHVRQRQCRRRHHGRSHQPFVPAAGQRPANDHHATGRLPR